MKDNETETYVNVPLAADVAEALREQAKDNGRSASRELAQIAGRALRARLAAKAGANN